MQSEITMEDRKLLERLYREYSPLMLRAAAGAGLNQQDAEDAVGETFEYLARRALGKLRTMDEERLKATLLLAAKNRGRNLAEKQRRLVSLGVCNIGKGGRTASERGEDETLKEIGAFETRDAVMRAIAALPEELRETLYLHLIAGFTGAETAALIGADRSTVYKRIKRGRRLLREGFEKGGFFDD